MHFVCEKLSHSAHWTSLEIEPFLVHVKHALYWVLMWDGDPQEVLGNILYLGDVEGKVSFRHTEQNQKLACPVICKFLASFRESLAHLGCIKFAHEQHWRSGICLIKRLAQTAHDGLVAKLLVMLSFVVAVMSLVEVIMLKVDLDLKLPRQFN